MDTRYLARTRCLSHRFLDHFDVQAGLLLRLRDFRIGELANGVSESRYIPHIFQFRNCVSPTVRRRIVGGRGRTARQQEAEQGSTNGRKTTGMVPSKMSAWSALLAVVFSISLAQGFVLSPAGLRASVHAPAGVRSNRASSCWRGSGKGGSRGISMQDAATAEEGSVAAEEEVAWAESQFPGCSTVLSKVWVVQSRLPRVVQRQRKLDLLLAVDIQQPHRIHCLCISGHLTLAKSLHAHHLVVATTSIESGQRSLARQELF